MIQIVAIGKLKETYLREGQDYFFKKISQKTKMEILELEDEPIFENYSERELQLVRKREGERILEKINAGSIVVVMDINGKKGKDSVFFDLLKRACKQNRSLTLVIGGSIGLSEEIKRRADEKISFADLTFPHQLFRLMLLEKIFSSLG